MTHPLTSDDLAFMADWIDAYDDGGGDENTESQRRILAWVAAEQERRQVDAIVRKVRRDNPGRKVGRADARAALESVRTRRAAGV